MDLLDRILGLKNEQQQMVDKLIAIIEENEDLLKDKEKLEKQVAELEEELQCALEELNKEKDKVRHIEEVIENSMAQIRDMK
jgi:chromosome segregation ATPase